MQTPLQRHISVQDRQVGCNTQPAKKRLPPPPLTKLRVPQGTSEHRSIFWLKSKCQDTNHWWFNLGQIQQKQISQPYDTLLLCWRGGAYCSKKMHLTAIGNKAIVMCLYFPEVSPPLFTFLI